MVIWCKKIEYYAQIPSKSELCGFKWANTHNKWFHDPMAKCLHCVRTACALRAHCVRTACALRAYCARRG